MSDAAEERERRVLVLAPTARDAAATREVLGAAGVAACVCEDLERLCSEAAGGAGAILLPEEALAADSAGGIRRLLAGQPAWSDMPLVVLTPSGPERPRVARVFEQFRNATLVKRPVELSVLVSVVRAALRDRARQYEVRAHLSALEHRAEELKSSEEALREADRRKDEFLAMLAHELRNPLAAISSAATVASRPEAGAFVPGALEVIQRQSKNLSRLVSDLLDVARISQGKVELKRETVDVVAAAGQAAQGVRPLMERKGQEFAIHIACGRLLVDADPTRLEQVVGNLLTNASKYTESGGKVVLSIAREAGDAVLRVEDSGVGIAPEMLPKVFDLFTQVDDSLARSEGGLGIGLTLVKRLVDMHGGEIEAASELGRGSVFTVRLPAIEGASADASAAGPVAAAGRRRVLIIDDNLDSSRLLGAYLEMLGYDVRVSNDGRRGVEAARSFAPEAVVLDIGLPDLDGYEVARRLRAEETCREALVVAVSGYTDDSAMARGRDAGFDHHLAKPVDVDALTSLLVRGGRPPGGDSSRSREGTGR